MIEITLIIAIFIISVIFAIIYRNLRNEHKIERESRLKAEAELGNCRIRLSELDRESVQLTERVRFLQIQLQQAEAAHRQQLSKYEADQSSMTERFKLLANEIMEANANRFRNQSESRLSELLLRYAVSWTVFAKR